MRNQEWGTGNEEPGMGTQKLGTRNGEPGTENQEWGTGNREPVVSGFPNKKFHFPNLDPSSNSKPNHSHLE